MSWPDEDNITNNELAQAAPAAPAAPAVRSAGGAEHMSTGSLETTDQNWSGPLHRVRELREEADTGGTWECWGLSAAPGPPVVAEPHVVDDSTSVERKSFTTQMGGATTEYSAGRVEPRTVQDDAIAECAKTGWRGLINGITPALIKLKPNSGENMQREYRRNIKADFYGHFTIAAIALTDNVGLTSATIGAASVMAQIRGPLTVVLDMKSGPTNTRERFTTHTTNTGTWRGLVDMSERADVTVTKLDEFVIKNEQNVGLLAKPENIPEDPQENIHDFDNIMNHLKKSYRILFVLCPNNPNTALTKRILDTADSILTVTTDTENDLTKTRKLNTWLTANGYANLSQKTCVAITEKNKQRNSVRKITKDRIDSLEHDWTEPIRVPYVGLIQQTLHYNIDNYTPRIGRAYTRIANQLSEWY